MAGSFILYVMLVVCPIHSSYVIACLICKLLFCREYNIKLHDIYSDLTDEALDEALQNIIGLNRSVGAEGARARLHSHGITVPRQRVRDAMERIDPAGVAIRALHPKLQRRTYAVAGPNSLWHIDGNHKLIR